MSERKAVIKNADMSEDMQQDAVDCASQALEKYNIEKVNAAQSICAWLFVATPVCTRHCGASFLLTAVSAAFFTCRHV